MIPVIKDLGKVRPTSEGTYSSDKEYSVLSIVSDKNTAKLYISKKDVPANTPLEDTEYWNLILDYEDEIKRYVEEASVIKDKSITPNKLSDDFGQVIVAPIVNRAVETIKPVIIEGTVTNAADEEDLTSDGSNLLKFKDKLHSPITYSGLGRKYLRKNLVNGVNTLTQDMFKVPNGIDDLENTIFIIQYDYIIPDDSTIIIPAGCTLQFEGGSINGGGTLVGNDTIIDATPYAKIIDGVTFSGKWATKDVYAEWFGAESGFTKKTTTKIELDAKDSTPALLSAVQYLNNNGFGNLILSGLYLLKETLYINDSVGIIGKCPVNIYTRTNSSISAGFFCDFINPYSWCIDTDVYVNNARLPYRYNFSGSNVVNPKAVYTGKLENFCIKSSQDANKTPLYGGIRLISINGSSINNVSVQYTKVGIQLYSGWHMNFSHVDLQVLCYGLLASFITSLQINNICSNIRVRDTSIFGENNHYDITSDDTIYDYFQQAAFPEYYSPEERATKKYAVIAYACSNIDFITPTFQSFDTVFSLSNTSINIGQIYLEDVVDSIMFCNTSTVYYGNQGGTIWHGTATPTKDLFNCKYSTFRCAGFGNLSAKQITFNALDSNSHIYVEKSDLDYSVKYLNYNPSIHIDLGDTLFVGGSSANDDNWGVNSPISLNTAINRIQNNKYYASVKFIIIKADCTLNEDLTLSNRDIVIRGNNKIITFGKRDSDDNYAVINIYGNAKINFDTVKFVTTGCTSIFNVNSTTQNAEIYISTNTVISSDDNFTIVKTNKGKVILHITSLGGADNASIKPFSTRTSEMDYIYNGDSYPAKIGTSVNRPNSSWLYAGYTYYDTTIKKPIYWDGTCWVDSNGLVLANQ